MATSACEFIRYKGPATEIRGIFLQDGLCCKICIQITAQDWKYINEYIAIFKWV